MINVRGFSLNELVIVVAIIGIMAAIAYPSYRAYKVHTNRADAQTDMLMFAQSMQAYRSANGTYLDATVADIYGGTTIEKSGGIIYDLSFDSAPTATNWVLKATPNASSIQAGSGVLCLNDRGHRYWEKAATNCNKLSSVSNWDGR